MNKRGLREGAPAARGSRSIGVRLALSKLEVAVFSANRADQPPMTPTLSSQFASRLVGGASAIFLPFAASAGAAPPPAGMPLQLAPPNACYSSTAAGGCSAFGEGPLKEPFSIAGAQGIAISGDGLNLYATGSNGGGVAFARTSGGSLAAIGSAGAFADTEIATSGQGLYVGIRDFGSDNGGVAAFARGSTGALSNVGEVLDKLQNRRSPL